ncbi:MULTISPECIES: hypothetical protein [unclassified Mesorhizobium]|uniref:hypothetical protein n=1 Tax=unclassified Mesorhizobium TaxID=325217 RepID=UPI00112C0222|nr:MULTISPECIES: hypothetical protein [unclassified Mesorhizobium]TPK94519.1 hypothetical protein FJ567_24550 [Mesorhizobium sp. B2-4-16]TPL60906.1 hypothetical protein FJ956_27020 [Mesorhizobium sp. B2-4-3]
MTSVVGSQHGTGLVHNPSKPSASPEALPGKSAESVGHLAKASVSETDDSEPNAQGKAASRIARMDLTVLSSTGSGEGQEPDAAVPTDRDAGGTQASDPSI